jgi:hypothetical protein
MYRTAMVDEPRPSWGDAATNAGLRLLLLGTMVACTSTGSGLGGAPLPIDGPPAPAAVRDGIDADLDAQDMRSSLFANWDPFVDPEGLPVIYEWSIGTSPGNNDVMPWTSVGGATRGATEGIALPDQQVLYVSVRATDLAGNRSATSTSDGIKIGGFEPSTATPQASATEPSHYAAIERFGVTWTFAKPVLCGHFVNGDWWVLGPVDLVTIDPASRADNGRTRHGSMINPDPRQQRQGYDSSMFGEDAAQRYDPASNVAFEVSRSKPLHLQPGSSLVSTISIPEAGQMPQLQSCAILTCLAEVPPEDAFRPPYCGADKSCRRRAGSLDLTRLARVEGVPGVPDLRELLAHFERPWLDHQSGWSGRYLHPRDNMPDYGRDVADLVGQAALVLQLELPDTRKHALAVQLTQLGIDLYGIVASGGHFAADGGSGGGRKFPVLLAGTLLQDPAMLQLARERKLAFAEDAQTFYVAETAPGVVNQGQGGYGVEDLGLAEWGNRHADDARLDQKPWTADPYRRCCTANAWLGFVLAARIMGLREAWDHPALFDYVDRYAQIEAKGAWTRSWSPFVERMWDRHRSSY